MGSSAALGCELGQGFLISQPRSWSRFSLASGWRVMWSPIAPRRHSAS